VSENSQSAAGKTATTRRGGRSPLRRVRVRSVGNNPHPNPCGGTTTVAISSHAPQNRVPVAGVDRGHPQILSVPRESSRPKSRAPHFPESRWLPSRDCGIQVYLANAMIVREGPCPFPSSVASRSIQRAPPPAPDPRSSVTVCIRPRQNPGRNMGKFKRRTRRRYPCRQFAVDVQSPPHVTRISSAPGCTRAGAGPPPLPPEC